MAFRTTDFIILFGLLYTSQFVNGYVNITSLFVGAWNDDSESQIKGIEIFVNSMDYLSDILVGNDDALTINGEKLRLRIELKNGRVNKTFTEELYRNAFNDPSISFFLSPIVSSHTQGVIDMANDNKRLILSSRSSFNDQAAGTSCCLSVGLSASTTFFVTLPSLRVAGAQTITLIITEGQDTLSDRCHSQAFRNELRLQGFSIKSEYIISPSPNNFLFAKMPFTEYTDEMRSNMSRTALQAMADDADAWLFCGTLPDAVGAVLSTVRDNDYTPRYVSFTQSASHDVTIFDNDLWQYVTVSAEASEDVTFPPTKDFGNITNIKERFYDKYGEEFPDSAVVLAAWFSVMNSAIGSAIAEFGDDIFVNANGGLELSTDNNTANVCGEKTLDEILYQYIFRLKLDTIVGQYSWDVNSAQQRDWLHLQMQKKGEYILIGPPTTKHADLIYPMPKWHERIFDPQYGHWTELLVTVITVLFFCINIVWAVFLPLNLRDSKVKASSPLFMGLMIVGSSLLYLSVFTILPNVVSKVTCSLSIWVIDLGFILLFGPLLGKTLRLDRLYSMKTTQIIRIRDRMVLLWVGSLVAGHLILLTIMTAVGTFERKVVVVDPIRVYKNYHSCEYDIPFKVIMYIIAASNAFLLIVCSIFAFRIRLIPIKRYNESKIIFFTVYNVFFFAVLSVVLAATDINRFTRFVLVSVFILFGSAITVNSFFLHKTQACICMDTSSIRTQSSEKGNSSMNAPSSSFVQTPKK